MPHNVGSDSMSVNYKDHGYDKRYMSMDMPSDRDYVAETRQDFADFDRKTGLSDEAFDAIRQRLDDEAQMQSLRAWRERQERTGSGGYAASWPTVVIGVGLLVAEIIRRMGVV